MNITKKVKYALAIIWVFALCTMMIGTVLIGRSYLDELYGDDSSIKSLYTLNDPIKDIYRKISLLKEEIINYICEEPESFEDVEFLKKLDRRLSKFNTSLVVAVDGSFTYLGSSEGNKELISQLATNLGLYSTDDSLEDEKAVFTEIAHDGRVYEYIMTAPALYLCNQIYFFSKGRGVTVFLLTNYGNYTRQFRRTIIGYVFIMILIMLFLSAVLSLVVYRQFVKPLLTLKKAAADIGGGNLDTPVDVYNNRTDEVGELCRAFNDMRMKLKETVTLNMQYEEENRELISNISHDLKTPITTIKGYVEGLMDGVADTPEKQERYIRMIYNKANELDVLINELSLYTNINNNAIPYEFHRVNVKDYFSDCMDEIKEELKSHNMVLKYNNYCKEDVKIIVDPDQLKRVINNIVSNAIKYLDKDEGCLEIYIHDEGKEIKVSISDDGRGIDEESLPHVFDRTYRADSARQSHGGSGLGLAICKKIVEEHGGKIWARSQKGHGTTIYFTLKKYTKEEVSDEQNTDN